MNTVLFIDEVLRINDPMPSSPWLIIVLKRSAKNVCVGG